MPTDAESSSVAGVPAAIRAAATFFAVGSSPLVAAEIARWFRFQALGPSVLRALLHLGELKQQGDDFAGARIAQRGADRRTGQARGDPRQ